MSSFHTWPTKTKGYMLEREMARRKYLLGTTNLPFSRSIRIKTWVDNIIYFSEIQIPN